MALSSQATKNVDGLEINLERFHDPNIEILPLDKNAAQIVQWGHPLAKKLPLWLNLRPSASQHLINHGVFTSFQRHGPVSVDTLLNAMEVIFDIKLVKVTCPINNHVVKENQMVASWTHQKWFYAPYCIVEMFFQLIQAKYWTSLLFIGHLFLFLMFLGWLLNLYEDIRT